MNYKNIALDFSKGKVQISIRGNESKFFLHVHSASESEFRWQTFEAMVEWMQSSPPLFEFQSFPDDVATESGESNCAIVIGILPESIFFGYQGFETFWGDFSSQGTVSQIFDTLSTLRSQTLSSDS